MLSVGADRISRFRPYLRHARIWFRSFRRTRPFWGGLWLIIGGGLVLNVEEAGIALALSRGAAGFGGWLTGGGMVLCGIAVWLAPTQRFVAGLLGLLFAIASLVAANLGGLFVGMLAGIIGGSMTIAWGPKKVKAARGESPDDADAEPAEAASDGVEPADIVADPDAPEETVTEAIPVRQAGAA